MIDRVNCEGRRVLVKEEAKRKDQALDVLRRVRLWQRFLSRPARFRDCPIRQRRCSVSSSWLSCGGLSAFCPGVCYRGGDGGALRCGRGISVGATFSTFASSTWWLCSLLTRSRYEDERSYEAHRAGDCAQVPAYVPMPDHRSTCHGHGSRPRRSQALPSKAPCSPFAMGSRDELSWDMERQGSVRLGCLRRCSWASARLRRRLFPPPLPVMRSWRRCLPMCRSSSTWRRGLWRRCRGWWLCAELLLIWGYGEGRRRMRRRRTRQRPVARTVLAALRNSLCGRRRMRRLQAR